MPSHPAAKAGRFSCMACMAMTRAGMETVVSRRRCLLDSGLHFGPSDDLQEDDADVAHFATTDRFAWAHRTREVNSDEEDVIILNVYFWWTQDGGWWLRIHTGSGLGG